MHITTKAVSSNPVHGEVYLIQHYVMKCVSDLRQGRWFSLSTLVSSNKTDHHDITEIFLKVALYTINQPTKHVEVPKSILYTGLQTGLGSLWTFITCNSSLLHLS